MPYKNKEDKLAWARRYYKASQANRDNIKSNTLKRYYGITLEDYKEKLNLQKGVCKICGRLPPEGKSLHVDHDHKTGKVRDLLCFTCNATLGTAKDSIDILRMMVAYLEEHSNSSEH